MIVGCLLRRVPMPRSERPLSRTAATLAVAGLASLLVTGCTPTLETHGHSLDEAQIAKIVPGSTSQQQVLQLMGSPSALASFNDDAWYYVSQRTEKKSFYQEDLVAQDVITVRFDDQGRVSAVDRHGLDQMAAIDPVDRVTPTAGASPSVFRQLIGNIGRFSDGGQIDPDR